VQPRFVVVQGVSSRGSLEELAAFFGCGKLYMNHRRDNHREDLLMYIVQRYGDLRNVIIPFFRTHRLQTSKRYNFEKFAEVMDLMDQGKHLTIDGLIEIAEIAQSMNHRKPSKVLRILRDHTPTNSKHV